MLGDIKSFAQGQLRRDGESRSEAVVVAGKSGARGTGSGGRRVGSERWHTIRRESALPLAAPFLLASTYTAQSREQRRA